MNHLESDWTGFARDVAALRAELHSSSRLPHLQEPIFRRVRKLIDVMVGNSSMRRVRSLTSPMGFRAEESLPLSAEVPTVDPPQELAPPELQTN
jgi:hypothetical protein